MKTPSEHYLFAHVFFSVYYLCHYLWSRSIEPVSWAHSCTAVSPGPFVHDRKLNTFHMRCLQHIFGITWQDKVPNRVSPRTSWNFQHVYIIETALSTLAWAHCENGWWSDSKRSPVWRISAGKSPQTTAAIQGYLQAGSEGLRNGPQQMGNLEIWVFSLQAGGASWPLAFWRDICSASRGKEAVLKPAKSGSWTGDRLYFSSVWKGWSLSNWPFQPTRHCSKSSIQSMIP